VRPPVPRLGIPRHGCSRGSTALMTDVSRQLAGDELSALLEKNARTQRQEQDGQRFFCVVLTTTFCP
jgi:hypothetical protein